MNVSSLPFENPNFTSSTYSKEIEYQICCGDDDEVTREMMKMLRLWKCCMDANNVERVLECSVSPDKNFGRPVVIITPRKLQVPEALSMGNPAEKRTDWTKTIFVSSLTQTSEVRKNGITGTLDIEGFDDGYTISYQLNIGQPFQFSYQGRRYVYEQL